MGCTADFECVQDLVLSDLAIVGGELNAATSIETGPNLSIDGTGGAVVLKAGETIGLGNGTRIVGTLTASVEATPCQ